MRIAIVGPPGSGKGAQTGKIAKHYNLKHVVVGDAVKQEIRNKTELGKVLFELTNVGKFVPSDIVVKLLKEQVQDLNGYDGYIIDTAPINLDQKRLIEKEMNLEAVVSLKISDFDVVRERILKRLICPVCREVTSVTEAADGACPVCGNVLEKRYDDKLETINIRLQQYERETMPVIEEYRKEGKLIEIDAERSKPQVFNQICEKINEFFGRK